MVIQQRVVQPPYVGIFNSFSPVEDKAITAMGKEKKKFNSILKVAMVP